MRTRNLKAEEHLLKKEEPLLEKEGPLPEKEEPILEIEEPIIETGTGGVVNWNWWRSSVIPCYTGG